MRVVENGGWKTGRLGWNFNPLETRKHGVSLDYALSLHAIFIFNGGESGR